MLALTKSSSEYFVGNKENSRISIKVIPFYAIDGTVKK